MKSISTIVKHNSHLKSYLAAPKSQTTFFTLIINYYYDVKKRLKSLTFFTCTNNYYYNLRLETLIFSTLIYNYYCNLKIKIFIFSIFINNYCYDLKKKLKIQPVSTTSIIFISGSNIFDVIYFSIKLLKINYTW